METKNLSKIKSFIEERLDSFYASLDTLNDEYDYLYDKQERNVSYRKKTEKEKTEYCLRMSLPRDFMDEDYQNDIDDILSRIGYYQEKIEETELMLDELERE